MHTAQVSLNKYSDFIAGKFAYFFRRQKMANARYTYIHIAVYKFFVEILGVAVYQHNAVVATVQ